MILPFKGSPWRPIYISVLLCCLIGAMLSALGLLALIAVAVQEFSAARKSPVGPLEMMAGISVYLGIGVLYCVCAYWINRLRLWAAIVALSITSIGLLVGLCAFAESLSPLFPLGHNHFGDDSLWFTFGGIWLLELMVLALLGLLIRELIRSFGSIRILLRDSQRGFEVMPMQGQDRKND